MPARAGRGAVVAALLIGIGAGIGFGAGPAAVPARAQVSQADIDDLGYRLRQLERQFNALGGPGGDVPPSLATRFQSRLDQMERSIQSLTDKIETLTHRVEQAGQARKAFETDTDYRLSLLEKPGGAKKKPPAGVRNGAGAAPPPAPGAARPKDGEDEGKAAGDGEAGTADILPPGREVDQYRFAIGELRQARYVEAEQAFRAFLRRHSDGRFAGNAYYWLGETYYAQGKYRLAAIRFADGFRKFPKHAKAPDNLLKLGMTMARLKKTKEACESLAELKRRFPKAPNYVKRRAARERKKLGCRG